MVQLDHPVLLNIVIINIACIYRFFFPFFAETRGGSANGLANPARFQGSRAKEMRGERYIIYADREQIQGGKASVQSGQRSGVHRWQRRVRVSQWYKLGADEFKCPSGYVRTVGFCRLIDDDCKI